MIDRDIDLKDWTIDSSTIVLAKNPLKHIWTFWEPREIFVARDNFDWTDWVFVANVTKYGFDRDDQRLKAELERIYRKVEKRFSTDEILILPGIVEEVVKWPESEKIVGIKPFFPGFNLWILFADYCNGATPRR